MLNAPNRHWPLAGTHNLRDLGGYRTEEGTFTRWRSLLRADSLHRLDSHGAGQLEAAGLKTVIDLRFENEKASAPQPFQERSGVRVIDIPLFAKLNIAGRSGSSDEDLLFSLYCSALTDCSAEISHALTSIAEADDGMVLFHCTAGKDRTGILAALILLAMKVPDTTIVDDYSLTSKLAEPMLKELLAEMDARGQDRAQSERLLLSNPATMSAMIDHITARYGGIGPYLAAIGIDSAGIARLRARLLAA